MSKKRKLPSQKSSIPLLPDVKKVVLPPAAVLHVAVAPGHVPVVAVDPVRNVVEIVPVKKKKTWWQSLIG